MPRTLLLADDSITIQKVVAITFAGEDFTVVASSDGAEALDKARAIRPDIVVADVVMPRKNGYELCEAIKGDPELGAIPVLLLAGTFEAFDEARARAARADGHIAKPFESQALINKVKELVARPTEAPAAAPAAGSMEALDEVWRSFDPVPSAPVAAPTPAPSPAATPAEHHEPPELDWSELDLATDAAAAAAADDRPPPFAPDSPPVAPQRSASAEPRAAAPARLEPRGPDAGLLPFGGEPIDLAELQMDDRGVEPAQQERAAVELPGAQPSQRPEPPGVEREGEGRASDGGEAALREALSRASREVVERIAWEVVPALAEVIIREHVERLAKDRKP